MSTLQTSAVGEYIAMQELAGEGYSVAKPIPDLGIDLLAVKIENDAIKTRAIQVKTSGRYEEVKNIARKKSHNLYGFSFKRVIDGCEYWFVFLQPTFIVKLGSDELKQRIGL